ARCITSIVKAAFDAPANRPGSKLPGRRPILWCDAISPGQSRYRLNLEDHLRMIFHLQRDRLALAGTSDAEPQPRRILDSMLHVVLRFRSEQDRYTAALAS